MHEYNKIQYKHEYYYSGINAVEFRDHRDKCENECMNEWINARMNA